MASSGLWTSTLRRNLLTTCILAGFGGALASPAYGPIPGSPVADDVTPVVVDALRHARSSFGSGAMPFAATGSFIVTNCNDAGPGSLRQAMLDASGNSAIDLSGLSCDRITLTSGALTSSASIGLMGPGSGLTIDGNGTAPVIHHDGPYLGLNGLALVNGRDTSGMGGCLRSAGDVSITDSRISDCVAGGPASSTASGGGIYVGGHLALTASVVTGNLAIARFEAYGGGIRTNGIVSIGEGSVVSGNRVEAVEGSARGGGAFSIGTTSVFGHARIEDNEAVANFGTASGGGLQAQGAFVLVEDSLVNGNTAFSGSLWAQGGGIQAGSDSGGPGDLYLIGSTLSGNTAQTLWVGEFCWARGGGASARGRIEAEYSTVRDNLAQAPADAGAVASGGGLATVASGMQGRITLQSTTLSGNAATCGDPTSNLCYGGGGAATASYFVATNSTIAFNFASSSGGGLVAATDPAGAASFLANSIVARNLSPSAPDIDLAPSNPGVLTVLGEHNLVTTSNPEVGLPADTLAEDPLLQPLQSNGGATATHALPACSSAVDAGSNPKLLDHDQRGAPYARQAGAAPDIGAFELQPDPDRILHDGFEPQPCP